MSASDKPGFRDSTKFHDICRALIAAFPDDADKRIYELEEALGALGMPLYQVVCGTCRAVFTLRAHRAVDVVVPDGMGGFRVAVLHPTTEGRVNCCGNILVWRT